MHTLVFLLWQFALFIYFMMDHLIILDWLPNNLELLKCNNKNGFHLLMSVNVTLVLSGVSVKIDSMKIRKNLNMLNFIKIQNI